MQALLPISVFVLHPILFPPEEGRPHSILSTVKNGAVWGRCGLQQSDQECPSRRRKGFRLLAEMLCVLESPSEACFWENFSFLMSTFFFFFFFSNSFPCFSGREETKYPEHFGTPQNTL